MELEKQTDRTAPRDIYTHAWLRQGSACQVKNDADSVGMITRTTRMRKQAHLRNCGFQQQNLTGIGRGSSRASEIVPGHSSDTLPCRQYRCKRHILFDAMLKEETIEGDRTKGRMRLKTEPPPPNQTTFYHSLIGPFGRPRSTFSYLMYDAGLRSFANARESA